jgi:hypothetical protein
MTDMIFHLAEQLPLKGRERGRGWIYGGGDSREFTRENTQRLISYFAADDYPNLVTAANTFLRTCSREGMISSINTWDGQTLTWGVGFAYGAINRVLFPMLSNEVKNELIRLVPSRFSESGINVDQSIRKDRDTLASLIYVSETDPFRDSVFRAMFKGFTIQYFGQN